MHGFSYDRVHDEIVVNSPLTQSILTFRGSVNGEEAPIRVIQGPKTRILGMGYAALSTVTADPEHNEIFLPVGSGGYRTAGTGGPEGVLVFDRMANGDVAPKRILAGPDTQIRSAAPQVAVDPVHNLLIVKSNGLLIFDRTASGNARPKAVLRGVGPTGGSAQFEVYNGMVISPRRDDHIYAWSLKDTAENPRPLWRIPAPLGPRASQLGIVLDPPHKEVLIATGEGNQIRVFSVPELFDPVGSK